MKDELKMRIMGYLDISEDDYWRHLSMYVDSSDYSYEAQVDFSAYMVTEDPASLGNEAWLMIAESVMKKTKPCLIEEEDPLPQCGDCIYNKGNAHCLRYGGSIAFLGRGIEDPCPGYSGFDPKGDGTPTKDEH